MHRLVTVAVLAVCAACAPHAGHRRVPYHLYGAPKVGPDAYRHYIVGRSASAAGRHDVAIAEFRLAAKLAPEEAGPRVAIIEELLASGRGKSAHREAREVLREFPGRGSVWLAWGRIQLSSGHLAAAELALARAIFFDPKQEDAYLLAARVQQRLWRPLDARATYLRLLKQFPRSFAGHFFLGKLLLSQKQYGPARRALEQAVRADPDRNEPRVLLAQVLREQGKINEAIAVLEKAYRRSGEDLSLGKTLAYLYVDAGDLKQATEVLRHLSAPERSARARLDVGYLYLSLKLHVEALSLARELIAADASYQAPRLLAARALAASGDSAEAVSVALSVPPGDADVFEARALAALTLASSGELARAWRLLDDTPTPHRAARRKVALARADILQQQNNVGQARLVLDNVLSQQGSQPELVLARATLERRHGDPDRAVAMVQKLLLSRPTHVDALRFLGESWAERGVRLRSAERVLDKAIELAPNDGAVQAAAGWLRFRQGNLEDALATLRRADRLAPERPEILLHLGEVHLARGDKVAARDVFRRARPLVQTSDLRLRLDEGLRRTAAAHTKKK